MSTSSTANTAAENTTASAEIAAGPALAAHLAAVDTTTLRDHDLVEYLADTERLASWVASLQLAGAADFVRRPQRIEHPGEDLAAVSAGWGRPGRWVRDFADDELAARLKISRHDAGARIRLGCDLATLPTTRAALVSGRIDVRRARVFAEETHLLDRATAGEVEAAWIDYAEQVPASRLLPKVRAAAIAADTAAAEVRTVGAKANRSVAVYPAADGMADLVAHLPATEALSIQTAITAAARASKAGRLPGDDRTMDQRRADAFTAPFLEAMTTGELAGHRLAQHRGRSVELQVVVSASTLLGQDDLPGTLTGYGPITAGTVRELQTDARMRRLLTDPVSGTVLDVGTTVYKPPTPLLRHVQVRDQYCTFPGCGATAAASEFDHTVPFPHGPTSAANGAMRCKRHHQFKTSGAAKVARLPDGSSRWTMPTGHVHDVPLPAVGPVTDCSPASAARVRGGAPDRPADPDHGGDTETHTDDTETHTDTDTDATGDATGDASGDASGGVVPPF